MAFRFVGWVLPARVRCLRINVRRENPTRNEITDIVRDDEAHPLAKMMDVIGVLIAEYEDEHIPEPEGHPISVLKYFMEEHELKQMDLAELGSQGVVSEILNGRRELNLRQVKALSKRFNVPAAVFI